MVASEALSRGILSTFNKNRAKMQYTTLNRKYVWSWTNFSVASGEFGLEETKAIILIKLELSRCI
jgi:hypothetical protein